MQEFTGFYDMWTSLLGYYKTNEQAYMATERIYREHFGVNRYANFDSFKSTVSYHFNKNAPEKPKNKPVTRKKRKKK